MILKEHVSIDETKHQESQQKSTLWFCTSWLEDCNYAEMKSEMICDCLMVGIRDISL